MNEISEKLAAATPEERNSYRITSSGYGTHWNLLDEDLSINGLIKTVQPQASRAVFKLTL
ncbi:MAG: DUF2442 domain-containing protein [Bacteroidota bacterium]|nr:DUF2442 domain-containing protein [Bacteroidota bacterium]